MHCLDNTWQLLPQCGGPERAAQQMSQLGWDRATQGASDDAQGVPPGHLWEENEATVMDGRRGPWNPLQDQPDD